ncbi:hypothetical protein LY624_12595 [Pseudoalteromonas sp. N1230-9]|uniref:hypothetical protein n=1 Tax=Pseudoalteromonas sp. N1230-9 TaxID=2907156 RepID=UPI002B301B2E|nr:hypothetical protein LY624_12595 [Pseudoalteromonas sp. N1230-9]
MYRFTVKNNFPDHKPFVVFFCFLALLLYFSYSHILSELLACFACLVIGVVCFKKVKQAQPSEGVIILQQSQLGFFNEQLQLQGKISPKSYVFANHVVIRLIGFYQSHWLIISSASVDELSFSRLRRAVIAVQQPA